MSSFNFDSLPPKYLKKDSITRLYNTVNEKLELKDSSVKCVETTAFFNGLYFIVVYILLWFIQAIQMPKLI